MDMTCPPSPLQPWKPSSPGGRRLLERHLDLCARAVVGRWRRRGPTTSSWLATLGRGRIVGRLWRLDCGGRWVFIRARQEHAGCGRSNAAGAATALMGRWPRCEWSRGTVWGRRAWPIQRAAGRSKNGAACQEPRRAGPRAARGRNWPRRVVGLAGWVGGIVESS